MWQKGEFFLLNEFILGVTLIIQKKNVKKHDEQINFLKNYTMVVAPSHFNWI